MTRARNRVDETLALGRAAFDDDWHPSIVAAANGRIEVIGNHIDYSGGPVIAAAIDRGICVAVAKTSEAGIHAAFPDVEGDGPVPLDVGGLADWRSSSSGGPTDYLRGVIAAARARRLTVRPGLRLVVHGDVPVGGGVSSSAALCVALTLAVVEEPLTKPELVLLAQEAEHRAGTPCGTMDQSASVFGGVILFGGSPDRVTPLDFDLGARRFLVLGSGVARSLATSAYADRVEESRDAFTTLRGTVRRPVEALADISPEEVESARAAGAFDGRHEVFLRSRHVVTETARVREAVAASEAGDWRSFGELMSRSGRSSATDYAISHPVVEDLVALTLGLPGVLGARMMGGGEGGNALALVEETNVADVMTALLDDFYRPRGLDGESLMFVCRVGEAASVSLVAGD